VALPRSTTAASRLEAEDGVTLIELLVVLIIIGILAAIVVAAFTKQQDKAHDADAKAAARTAQLAMETYFVDHRSYAGATVSQLQDVQPSLRDEPSLAINSRSSNAFELQTTSSSTNPVTYVVRHSANGTIQRTCAPANAGGCRGGSW
jgi:prepilin-type N-terminal cleavage/methylation domain-containing protein